jgi:hypothetical protein
MIFTDSAVVNGFLLATVTHLVHGDEMSVVATQHVAELQISRFDPALPHVKRMFRGRADHLAFDVHMPNRQHVVEDLLDTAECGSAVSLTRFVRFGISDVAVQI